MKQNQYEWTLNGNPFTVDFTRTYVRIDKRTNRQYLSNVRVAMGNKPNIAINIYKVDLPHAYEHEICGILQSDNAVLNDICCEQIQLALQAPHICGDHCIIFLQPISPLERLWFYFQLFNTWAIPHSAVWNSNIWSNDLYTKRPLTESDKILFNDLTKDSILLWDADIHIYREGNFCGFYITQDHPTNTKESIHVPFMLLDLDSDTYSVPEPASFLNRMNLFNSMTN